MKGVTSRVLLRVYRVCLAQELRERYLAPHPPVRPAANVNNIVLVDGTGADDAVIVRHVCDQPLPPLSRVLSPQKQPADVVRVPGEPLADNRGRVDSLARLFPGTVGPLLAGVAAIAGVWASAPVKVYGVVANLASAGSRLCHLAVTVAPCVTGIDMAAKTAYYRVDTANAPATCQRPGAGTESEVSDAVESY